MTQSPQPGEIRFENGRLVRFIEREIEDDKWEVLAVADADGWIPHDGGPNPVPGCRVDVRRRDSDVQTLGLSDDSGLWEHGGHSRDIIAFRLAAPSVERDLGSSADADTHRATDGAVVGWQPMDTAPRDGQSILAICGTAYSPVAGVTWWQEGWTHYSRPAEKWHGGVGKWFPTHWMPLPDLTTTAAEPGTVGMEAEGRNEPKSASEIAFEAVTEGLCDPEPDVAGARERLLADLNLDNVFACMVRTDDLRLILSAYDDERAKRANVEWLLQGRNNELEIERLEVASMAEEIGRLRGALNEAETVIESARSMIRVVSDAAEDEVDRVYFGSSNHVDWLRNEAERIEARARQGGPDQ